VFQTVNAHVRLEDGIGTGLEGGDVKYAAGSWLAFGTTDANGEARKELLPLSYTFRMQYQGTTDETTQDVAIDPNVVFVY
jgi:hypothetical protein